MERRALLERDAILAHLVRLVDEAERGRGGLVLLGGEAGVGKTVLLRRFAAEVRERARVLIGACDALSTPRPLGPLLDVAADLGGDVNRLLVGSARRDLLLRAVLAALERGPRGQPTLLAIEDAHWADEATLDLLRFLGRRIEGSPALIVVTYRDDEVGPHHPLRRVFGDLAAIAAIERLQLPRLTPKAVAQLAAGSVLDANELYARTRGNPFFVTEVLAAAGELPVTVRDAVLARAARLPPSGRAMLEAAAVLGASIDPGLLARMVRADGTDLELAVSNGILQEHERGYAFRHELAREAILGAVGPERRAALHARALRLLESQPEATRHPARLAHHAEGAWDREAVLRYAPEAARHSAHLRSYREAAEQYARALRFADDLPPPEYAALLEARSHACYLTGQIDRAMADQAAALAIRQRIGDARKEGKNRCHLATLLWAQGRIVEAEREAEATVALMEQLQAGPELALAYGTLARLRGTTLADGEAIQLGEMAVALAERTGATETLVDALLTLGEANLARGAIGEGRQRIELGMRLATDAGLDELTARAFICLGHGFSECGHFATAAQHFERGIAYCVERDLDLPRHHLTVLLARCHLSLGTWDDAFRLATSVLDGRDVAPATRFDALLVVGLLRARRGDAGASPMLDEALALADVSGCVYFIGPVRAARAEAAFLSGDAVVAAAEARAAYDFAIERQHRRHASELAYWLWRAGELVVPPPDIFEPYAYQIAGDWRAAAAAWDAVGCPYEAARAQAEGDDANALRAALAVFDRLGANPATAMTGRRLRGLGGSVPRGPRATTRGNPAGLTRREAEVVRLLAEEHSNREIAVRLFLSARTVEHHVAAVLAKLAVGSRSDAVREAARQGLVAGPRSQSR